MGLATAKLLASRGATISLADLNESAMVEAIKSLPGSDGHMYSVVDVRKSESVNVWITSTVQKLGKLDGAVNMAGVITPATPITEESDDHWNFAFDVNARGVFFCLRAQLKAMSAGGSIVCSLPDSDLCVLVSATPAKVCLPHRSQPQALSVSSVRLEMQPTAPARRPSLV